MKCCLFYFKKLDTIAIVNRKIFFKYDMSLEKEARKMKSCDDFKHGVNYRVEDYGGKTSHPIWQGFVTSSVNKNTYLFMEEKHPLQTSFLHCDLTTPCLLDALRADNFANYTRSYIVLFGPRGTLSLSDFQHGPPGSKCTHGKTELDFCIAPPRSEMETSTPGSKIGITAPSRSEMETTGPSSENNGESEEVNSIFVYLCIAFMSLFL
ncbi:hypothetical protein GCK72_008587 [Caenorhabditis remanei]|uniref:Uncharacterized protein n=1 Tax=Caenorhabditis remanei TaxID=31234 RepID=A0A6A5GXY3_CAERE|nr:hypothetical protein GCK72_008587 [Caenorhabditis remanei]KAF1760338.1 hypothetical protein GCK72_008587 [Caenorhabditis remanei]